MITIHARESSAGVCLEKPFVLDRGVTVLTGKNGCGKTRMLNLIESHCTIVDGSGKNLHAAKFLHGSFSPDYGVDYVQAFLSRQQQAVQDFASSRDRYREPLPVGSRMVNSTDSIHDVVYAVCQKIMSELNKSFEDITHEDIRVYYFEPNSSLFGAQDLKRLFNTHVKASFDLQYSNFYSFLQSDRGAITREEVLDSRYQKAAPWDVLNKILAGIFKGKFYFAKPDESLRNYDQPVRLVDVSSGLDISVPQLSSGEKTLMWLALTVFNSQYLSDVTPNVPALLLLDEPDAFLHPQMVTEMYEVLDQLVKQFGIYVLITTHSPTTVALARGAIYTLEQNVFVHQDKDSAIAGLLDGVTQLSINPENRRQVYVESRIDANIYQNIFGEIINHSNLIDPRISLFFIPAGAKTPIAHLKECLNSVFKTVSDVDVAKFVELVNGVGDCGQVNVHVQTLAEAGDRTVRGIVDWDLNDGDRVCGVIVAARNYAYSLENILLDPMCLLKMVRPLDPKKYSMVSVCGVDVSPEEWLSDADLTQASVDVFIERVLGRPSKLDANIIYLDGRTVKTDSDYLLTKGKIIQEKVLKAYPEINSLSKKADLLYVVSKALISMGWNHIPNVFAETFSAVQK
ncbi:hypothetical protein ALP24_200137 [Pseudomonas syringae pv. aptata]|uniref:Endonuclease GajA/Old nuclease/RecF-like AAA domain-containing protein n=1 Tax=Pseudomonas syringae pv. aptata TaxID=83167 RepID=A0A3M5WSA9_PSEAP|nr:hypothetical protein ALP24_200137 [Pseudomonas syringae pv. aptata]